MSATGTSAPPISTPAPGSTSNTTTPANAGALVVKVSSEPPIPSWVNRDDLERVAAETAAQEAAEILAMRAANVPKSANDYKLAPLPPSMTPTPEDAAMTRELAFGQQWTAGEYSTLSMAAAGALYHASKGVSLEQYMQRSEDFLARRFGDACVDVAVAARRELGRLMDADPRVREISPHVLVDPHVVMQLAAFDKQRGSK